jgi:hypothetical protein
MFGEKDIKQHNIDQHRHILNMCGDEGLEKAISKEEFNEAYSLTHEVYSQESISNYQQAIAERVDEDPENADAIIEKAVSDFEPLQKVLVKSDFSVETFYVKEKSEESLIKSLEEELAEEELDEFLKGEAESEVLEEKEAEEAAEEEK